MSWMFSGCKGLTSLDLSGFNTGNVTDMSCMFSDCSGLTSLDISSFKTDNVTSMSYMFLKCSDLTSLDLSSFKTDNVREMGSMFDGCSSLTILDLSSFFTNSVSDMQNMFFMCSKLQTIYVNNVWTTDKVSIGHDMFSGCSSIVGGQGTTFDSAHTDKEYARIDGNGGPGYLTRSEKNNVLSAYGKFNGNGTVLTYYYDENFTGDLVAIGEIPYSQREKLTTVVFDASFANFTSITSTRSWFYGCSNLTTITGIENLKTDNVTDMSYMFYNCSSLTSLDLSGFKTDNVTSMSDMFSYCRSLTTIYVGNGWSTEKVTWGDYMFSGCRKLVGGEGTAYDNSHTDHTYARIDGGAEAPGYFTYKASQPDMKGDVNGDQTIDVADIASVISVMAEGSAGDPPASADVNGDGTVDVADIATIISIMAAKARQQEIED